MAATFIKNYPFEDFLLRKSNKPIEIDTMVERIVWAMSKYSMYEDQVAKAILQVMVSWCKKSQLCRDGHRGNEWSYPHHAL